MSRNLMTSAAQLHEKVIILALCFEVLGLVGTTCKLAIADDTAVQASSSSPAQDSSSNNSSGEKQERIEVTGSHIKRTDVEGVSPVETITQQDMQKKGYDNLGDVVRDLGVNSFGSGTVSGNTSTPGNADINLRGLGSDNTLVLLNGQRLPQDAITGTVDINLIPIAAVERMEILKDGASAIYGSDALGGVVNIITRKDFQGTELNASQTLPTSFTGGKETKVSLVNGFNTEKLNVVTSLSYRYDQAINSKDRPWSNNNYSLIGNPASFANIVSGQDGQQFAPNTCPADLLVTNVNGTYCRFKYSDYSQETPQIDQLGVMTEANYELSSSVRLNARLSYVHRDAQTVAAPSPGQLTLPAASVPPGLANAIPGDDLDVSFRTAALGPRVTQVKTNSYGQVFGATIQLPHDWTMDVTESVNLVKADLTGVSGFALASTIANLVTSGTVNPFAAAGSQGDYSSAAYSPTENTQTVLTTLETKASGELFDTAQGPVSLAVGALVSYAGYYDITDSKTLAGNVLGNAGSSGDGHRTSEAMYSEFSIPLVKKKLELQLAGRFDHYSDFGSTVNPKLGVLWHILPEWLVRGSVGTGFRAPLLSELYAGQSVGYPAFIDAVACAKNPGTSYCQAQQYQVTSGGNPNLKQETSISYTVGTVVAPTPNLNFGADWFFTNINNMPGIDYNDMTIAEQNGANPAQYGVIITRDSNGIIQNVVAPLQNLSQEQIMGVDLTAGYSVGRFKLMTEQNQNFFYKLEGFPGAGFENKLGWNGNPAWRNMTSVSYVINSNSDVSLTSHSIPHQKDLAKDGGYINPLTTFDVAYIYKTKKYGDFSVGVINVLNSQPPYDLSNPTSMVNYSLYDPNGRQIVLGYRKAI